MRGPHGNLPAMRGHAKLQNNVGKNYNNTTDGQPEQHRAPAPAIVAEVRVSPCVARA
jgi:hypothetical protein